MHFKHSLLSALFTYPEMQVVQVSSAVMWVLMALLALTKQLRRTLKQTSPVLTAYPVPHDKALAAVPGSHDVGV